MSATTPRRASRSPSRRNASSIRRRSSSDPASLTRPPVRERTRTPPAPERGRCMDNWVHSRGRGVEGEPEALQLPRLAPRRCATAVSGGKMLGECREQNVPSLVTRTGWLAGQQPMPAFDRFPAVLLEEFGQVSPPKRPVGVLEQARKIGERHRLILPNTAGLLHDLNRSPSRRSSSRTWYAAIRLPATSHLRASILGVRISRSPALSSALPPAVRCSYCGNSRPLLPTNSRQQLTNTEPVGELLSSPSGAGTWRRVSGSFITSLPTGAPRPGKPGPRRPPWSKNRRPAPHHEVGKTVKRVLTCRAGPDEQRRIRE